jgi:hypothetical protein
MRHLAVLSLCVFLISYWSSACAAEPISFGTLLEEMVDMVRLADFPQPPYKTVQFSSSDRRSVLPGGPDWFANSDGFGNEPQPNFEAVLTQPDRQGTGEYLICDVEGPGAVVRVWTAAIEGTIRVYLDDAQQPLYDGPADEFLHRPYARWAEAAGIDQALFDGSYSQRDACYFPIPFAKRCRIVWRGNVRHIHFYEVQVRRYAKDAEVVTFKPEDLKTHRPAIERVAKVLADPQGKWKYRSSQDEVPISVRVPARRTKEILALRGPAAIERLTLQLSAPDLDRALRQTIMQVSCDGFPSPQVDAPLGDFFGAAPGVNPFNSVPFTVQPDGRMTCRFVMPFARSCRIRLDNRGQEPVTVSGSALPLEYRWNEGTSMHFRAHWRVDHDLVANGGDATVDLPFLVANGKGVYVGTAVMLLNPSSIPTSYGSWWGEGDEKVFVDDDVRPSTFGTGSEDYFNYSWSVPDIFGYAYCGQPRDDGPANRGFVTNQRWHILDSLPFTQRIAFYMELCCHRRTPEFSYARIGYHYGRPGLIDDHVPITDEDVRHLRLPAAWQPLAQAAAQGATFYQAEDLVVDKSGTTLLKDDLWAGGQLLLWQPGKSGDQLTLKLPVAEPGKYVIRITAAHAPWSGTISVRLDDKPVGFGGAEDTLDFKTDYRTLSRTASSKAVTLTKGDHLLTLRCEGQPPTGQGAGIGIDFIWVQRQ